MSADDAPTEREEPQALQFDRVETSLPPGASATSPGVTCVVCGKAVGDEYFTVNEKPVCEGCRQVLISAAATPKSAGPLLRAGLFGLGAAIAGAAIYYAVIAIADLEIGIVAILIGYMVGYSVRKGAGGRGGRRFQILAAVLTYWAVGLAYTPLAFKELTKKGDGASSSLTADSTRGGDSSQVASRPDTSAKAATSSDDKAVSGRDALIAIGALVLMVFALPVLSIIGSMPMGLISALIIFIGLRQAWSMTAPHKLEISGPYKVGRGPIPAST
jgi:hypothetical protein